MSDDLSIAADQMREWVHDPVRYVREVFHVEPDPWQLEVLELAGNPGYKRIATGKAAVLGGLDGIHFSGPGQMSSARACYQMLWFRRINERKGARSESTRSSRATCSDINAIGEDPGGNLIYKSEHF
jgi:hypothetical protein